MPLEFADPTDYDSLAQGDTVRFPGIRSAILAGKTEIVVEAGGRRITTRLTASDRERKMLAAGGLLNLARTAK